ncbi:hypothetical protein SANA_00350 [Gottschalkiaceae bacterium SANA]|nr:hypothetical protein SANA_00350 [Gottschalkiaceae bacterium SANA]
MKRFLIAFLAALVVVGGIVAIGMSFRPGNQSSDVFGWFDGLSESNFHIGDGENGVSNLEKIELEDSIEWSQEQKITIDSQVSDVKIIKGDSNEIEVKTRGKVSSNIKVHLKLEKKKDSIQVLLWQERPESFITNTTNLDTVITLPKDFAGDLEIQSDVGDLDFGDFEGDSLRVNLDVGEVHGLVDAGEIEIETNVGAIDVSVIGGDIILKSDVGEIEFICEKADSLLVTADVGSIQATLSQSVIDAGVAADSGLGDVKGNVSFKEGTDREAAIQMYTDIGEVKINKQ